MESTIASSLDFSSMKRMTAVKGPQLQQQHFFLKQDVKEGMRTKVNVVQMKILLEKVKVIVKVVMNAKEI